MAEAVRMHGGVATQTGCVELDYEFDAAPGQPSAAVIEEDRRFRGFGFALREIAIERGFSFGAVRDLPLFSAFAANAQPALAAVDIFEVQAHQFAHTQPAAVEEFEYGHVARRMRPFELAGGHTVE